MRKYCALVGFGCSFQIILLTLWSFLTVLFFSFFFRESISTPQVAVAEAALSSICSKNEFLSVFCNRFRLTLSTFSLTDWGAWFSTQCEGAARWDTRKIFLAAVLLFMEDAVSTYKEVFLQMSPLIVQKISITIFLKALLVIQLLISLFFVMNQIHDFKSVCALSFMFYNLT